MAQNEISTKIVLTLLWLFMLQIVIVLLISVVYDADFDLWRWYIPATFLLHALTAVILHLLRDKFYTVHNQKKLHRVNLTNVLSLFRISTTPTLALFIIFIRPYRLQVPVIILTTLIFMSDFIDGKIARLLNQTTQIGRYIDSWSDYLILLAIGILFRNYALISKFFFIAMMIRFVVPIFGISILFIVASKTGYHSSWFGRASVFGVMVVIAFSVLRPIFGDPAIHGLALTILELTAICGFIVPALMIWIADIIRSMRSPA